nr:DNA-3-methyladenine glycosylase [Candidatus Saccharibacteria bacterium]NIV04046.1 DNA-3-methyladenine glycosylase [Calditrichia bacterium]NIV72423.1 DNA-3-methyladenine glycosylase [Calditrichia bacterium]NIV99500.1 DNA-3-methyladenine glycosylase [Candidatus Saccharibacteria bacterium]NIW79792.1 DNA-3-methyladenine glycosylase [Calditrichia bacterium]
TVARELLGTYLIRRIGHEQLIGKIVEVEAYIGEDDPACHASRGKTNRTALMFGPPGYAYIYFIYGMYYCLNAVTEAEGFPAAVLIRAVQPIAGIEKMKKLRKNSRLHQLTNGPGKLCQAFALDKGLNGVDLCSGEVFISAGEAVSTAHISVSSRIGIREGKDAPWRFYIKDNAFLSK